MNEMTETNPPIPQQADPPIKPAMPDEAAAGAAGAPVSGLDTSGTPHGTPPKKRPRARTVAVAVVCLAFLVGVGTAASFFVRYYLADRTAECGDYAAAYEAFTALNGFRDSPERAAEQYNLMRYAQAEALYQREEFPDAYDLFCELGDFRDAAERAETAQLMIRAAEEYDEAMGYYAEEDFDSLVRSYTCFEEMEVKDFRDSAQRMASLLTRLDALAVDYAAQGYCYRAPKVLEFLAQKGYPRTEELHAEILSREHIEPNDGYYDMDTSHIGSFNASTTPEEFFTLWRYMYLTGTTRLYLPVNRSGAAGSAYADRVIDRVTDGYHLSQIIFPEYTSIYDWYATVWWNDGGMEYMDMYTKWDVDYTADELAAHAETLDSFCRESIRILNEDLMLGASMSNEQKARVIYDWVCFYLSFDVGENENHDAGVAVETRLGVCESYVGIYARMCNLAGVPTYGQYGVTNQRANDDDTHIWTVQEDEAGNLFYTDPTWADWTDTLTKRYEEEASDLYEAFRTDYEERIWSLNGCFWQSELFESHTPRFDFPYEWVKSVTAG